MNSILASLALIFTAWAVKAETGPPTAGDVVRAAAACAAEVTQACLYTLAIDAALQDAARDDSAFLLNDIAIGQATAGDKAEAERTLSLTTPLAFWRSGGPRTQRQHLKLPWKMRALKR
jgi:hypothetical protein